MSELNNKEIENWSKIIPIKDHINFYVLPNEDLVIEENVKPSEARAWSKYEINNNENTLGEGLKKEEKSEDDYRAVERILSYVDQRRPLRRKKTKLNWYSFLGTMSSIEEIYQQENFSW